MSDEPTPPPLSGAPPPLPSSQLPPTLPPGPPPTPAAGRRRFWRSPAGVAAIVGITLASLVGVALAGFGIAMQLGYLPDSQAIAGSRLPRHAVEQLREADLVADDEQVLFFYGAGLASYLEDGNLFTDRRVVSYWQQDGELVVEQATYPEIEDLEVAFSGSWLEDTAITVVRTDGSEFTLFVSAERGGDKRFHSALKREWYARRR